MASPREWNSNASSFHHGYRTS